MTFAGFKKQALGWVNAVYWSVFGEDVSRGMSLFIKDFFYIIVGYGAAAVCVFVFQVASGRFFGPGQYGRYALVDSVAMFLHVAMILGVSTAAIKYSAQARGNDERRDIISTSLWIVLACSVAVAMVAIVAWRLLSGIFFVPSEIYFWSIGFAFFYTLYTFAVNMLRGLRGVKEIAYLRIVYGALLLVGLALFFWLRSFESIVLSIIFSYLVVSVWILWLVRRYLTFRINASWARKLFHYGTYAILGNICLAFLPSFNDLVINHYLTTADVGIYNAYYFSSIGIVIFLMTSFVTVFFPAVASHMNKETILKKIHKLAPVLLVVGIPTSVLFQWVIIFLYGDKYPQYPFLMFAFGVANVCIILYQLYNWFFYSEGMNGAKLSTLASLVTVVLNVALSLWLTRQFAFYGAALSLAVAYAAGIVMLLLTKHKLKLS